MTETRNPNLLSEPSRLLACALAMVWLALTIFGCGREEPARIAPKKVDATTRKPQRLTSPTELNTEILAKESISGSISAQNLTLYFRATESTAVFECKQTDAGTFVACPAGDRFRFEGLKDRETYRLFVRARSQSGAYDPSPDMVEFRVDLKAGSQPYLKADQPSAAADVRAKIKAQLKGEEQDLLLGPLFEMRAPSFMSVRNFSTTQTITNSVYAFSEILDTTPASGVGTEGCKRDWEAVVDVPELQRQYCESTPSISQWGTAYQRSYPLNHVELVGIFGGQTYERVLAAAYGPWPDASEQAFEGSAVCAGAAGSGRVLLPQLALKLGGKTAELQWCWFGKQRNAEWWQGAITLNTGSGIDAPRLKIVYGISAARGIYSSDHFIRRIDAFLPSVVSGLGETVLSQ